MLSVWYNFVNFGLSRSGLARRMETSLPPKDHHRALGKVLQGPRGGLFLIGKVPL